MISLSFSITDKLGLHTVLTHVRAMMEASDNPCIQASVTVCYANHKEAITILLDRHEDGSIPESYSYYKDKTTS